MKPKILDLRPVLEIVNILLIVGKYDPNIMTFNFKIADIAISIIGHRIYYSMSATRGRYSL